MKIGLYIYDQAEVLDFSGPFEVFSTASRICPDGNPFEVFLIGETGGEVLARGGYKVVPHFGFHDHPAMDVLMVVGGVHAAEMHKTRVIEWISRQTQVVALTASVCTGVFLLAKAGIADGRQVTTHWEDLSQLKLDFPALQVIDNRRWVEDRDLITSGGITAGIDMSLHLVSRLHSHSLAAATARQMAFSWVESP